MPGIMGTKIGMTRIFNQDGKAIPVTVIKTVQNEIVQIKTQSKDGYTALVVGYGELKRPKKTRKYRHLQEMKVSDEAEYKKGDNLGLGIFEEGETVSLSGTSKGKGFAGAIKRWNFSRGPETHGSHNHRSPGSVGACAKPGRINKGKKLPGHYGNGRVTLKNCEIVLLDPEKGIIAVKGAIPGAKNSLVTLKKK